MIKQYASELAQLKDLFPDWTREDIVFALDENEGDVQITAEKISEGSSCSDSPSISLSPSIITVIEPAMNRRRPSISTTSQTISDDPAPVSRASRTTANPSTV